MEQINSFEYLSRLISSHFKRGIRTNCYRSAADLKADAEAGRLKCHSWPGGMVIIRERTGFSQLYYYLEDISIPLDMDIKDTTVIEIPSRPKDTDSAELISFFESSGFKNSLTRIRLMRALSPDEPDMNKDTRPDTPVIINQADSSDYNSLSKLYTDCFDQYTGCIPEADELDRIIKAGSILCAYDENRSVCGFIEFTSSNASSEIRHLSVRADKRGMGIAGSLINYYIKKESPKRSLVWTGEDNKPAIRAYESCGYRADGLKSVVLIKNSEEDH